MLKVDKISYKYEDGTKALENINIDTSKGGIIGIIGANGSGKSTLFLNIMGILKPYEGNIIFNDKKLSYSKKELREYRRKVNLVFQNPDQQLFYSDVYDDVAFALRNLNIPEDEIKLRVMKSLEAVDALDLVEKPIHFLSYGQKKRVAIAGIVALSGDVILMDEPTSGLDPKTTDSIKDVIKKISIDRTVIISSHDMDLMYEICDYLYVLNHGKITFEGNKEEVFTNSLILKQANLKKPWLVKIHENLGVKLFKDEEEFNNYNLGGTK